MKICNIYKGLLLGMFTWLAAMTPAQAEVCFLPDSKACDALQDLNSGAQTVECLASKGQYTTAAECNNKTTDMSYRVCQKENDCYVAKCLYTSQSDCQSKSGVSKCKTGSTGCWVPDESNDEYPYKDAALEKCNVINSMSSKNNRYKIGSLVAGVSSYDSVKLKCNFGKADCDSISTTTDSGTVKGKYYIWNGSSNTIYNSIEALWKAVNGADSCPTDFLTCNNNSSGSINYYNSPAECAAVSGHTDKGCANKETISGKECYYYKDDSCPADYPTKCSETKCPAGQQIVTGSNSCCRCTCDSSSVDVEGGCFNWLPCQLNAGNAGITNLTCEALGFGLDKNALIGIDTTKYHCSACPLNGDKWGCEQKWESYDCAKNGYDRTFTDWMDLDRHQLAGLECVQCPTGEEKYKCEGTVCEGFSMIEGFDRLLMADECDFVQCPAEPLLWKCIPKSVTQPNPKKCPSGFSTSYEQICVKSEKGGYSHEWIEELSKYVDFIRESNEIPACKDNDYMRQLAGYSDRMFICSHGGSEWLKYRCVKGTDASGNECLSSSTVIHHPGAPEPCALLYNAKPASNCTVK